MMRYGLSIIWLLVGGVLWAQTLRVVSYNVENLFHPKHDSIAIIHHDSIGGDTLWVEKDDYEWTPEGERRWSYSRYYSKLHRVAKVLTHIGQWDGVDIVGLCEIENGLVVKQLCNKLRYKAYDYIHYESLDKRGIDVALIYKKSRVEPLLTKALHVYLDEANTTRDILYACCRIDRRDTVHLFVCHLPSMRGGATQSQWKRDAAKQVLQHAIDSVLLLYPTANIIVMGDMNCSPTDDIQGLHNRMMSLAQQGKGTHKWQGQWTCLDQFYTSTTLDSVSEVRIYDAEMIMEEDRKYMGFKPKRTFAGFRYQNGYSDHLPIVMDVKMQQIAK